MKVIRQGKTSPRQKCRGFCFRGGGRDAFPRRPVRRADAVVVRCVGRADASETRPYQDASLPIMI